MATGEDEYRDYVPPPQYAQPPQPPTQRPQPPPPTVPMPQSAERTQPMRPAGGGRGKGGALAVAAAKRTQHAAKVVTRKVISASKADGAEQSGLTALIWNQVVSYGADAMIVVALAGTVFFGASTDAQRGNILLYLLITMAPFAVVAPVIGPVLDRFQHGRRWVMAGTGFGRAALALVMAGHPSELLVLYPCALGSLVLSKAYGVVRAAAAPRLVPRGMTLGQANGRLQIFSLGSTLIFGGVVALLIKISGSYTFGLVVTALAYIVCGAFAFKLPHQVDSAVAEINREEHLAAAAAARGRERKRQYHPAITRLLDWAGRGFDENIVIALQGQSALRLLNGMLTIFLAFYVQATARGIDAAIELGAVVVAASLGNVTGTAMGARMRLKRPSGLIVLCTALAAAMTAIAALAFGIWFAVLAMLVSATGNALSKIALDALIQHTVAEWLRSSAFARSETFLQLAWVIGAALGVGLSARSETSGAGGLWIAAAIVGTVAVTTSLRTRVVARAERKNLRATAATAAGGLPGASAPASRPPGSVVPPNPGHP